MWDLLGNESLFLAEHSASCYDPQPHLAEMMTILGPQPKESLKKGGKTLLYFDANSK